MSLRVLIADDEPIARRGIRQLLAGAVGPAKQARLRRLAAEWLATTGGRGVEVRFDVVAITGTELDVVAGAF